MSGSDLRQRLAAILAADAVGYSRLMSLDERATVNALDAARNVFRTHIESNQGRVVDMAGDSVLALFETATGAVSAALAVQAEINPLADVETEERRMRFRIGVHLGDVIEKSDGTVYGDGINIAARLEGLAEPGGITISDAVRGAVKGKVNVGFEDQGEQTIKNISDPVRTFRLWGGAIGVETPAAKPSRSAAEIDLSLPDKPSIAVLPFTNMSGDPEQEYFTDGVTEDIITELSRFHSLFVIARNSSFTYKGKAVDVRTVAKQLGVRYVLEGSIRRAANRIRVTAQLIDAITGNHIWAEKYDRVLEDIFAVQEEVTRNIVVMVAPQIDAAELAKTRRRHPTNMTAYEISLRAWVHASDGFGKTDLPSRQRAIELAKQAIALDDTSRLAWNALSFSQFQHYQFRTSSDYEAAWEEAIAAADRAIDLDASDHLGLCLKALALAYLPTGDPRSDECLQWARRAHRLNPNDSFTVYASANCELFAGDPREALNMLATFKRLSPNDPWVAFYSYCNMMAFMRMSEFDQALRWSEQTTREAPQLPIAYFIRAHIYVERKQLDRAMIEMERLKAFAPQALEAVTSGRRANAKTPEQAKRHMTFIRVAAGLEDPSAADALR